MAEAKPLKAGSTGTEQFTATDTIPAANLTVMVGDSGSGGTKGAVPAPAAGDAAAGKFLKADGTWAAAGGSSPSVISPSQITSNQNNYAPTGWSTATIVRLSYDSGIDGITGFDAGTDGEEKLLLNVGTQPGYLSGENSASTAANRINKTAIHEPGGAIKIVYSDDASRWMVVYNTWSYSSVGVTTKGQFYRILPGSNQQADHNNINFGLSGSGSATDNAAATATLSDSWMIETGTTATGVSSIYIPKNNFTFGSFGGCAVFAFAELSVQTLSTSSQRYTAKAELLPGANSTTNAVNNAVGMRYSDNINSGKWECYTRNNSGTETTLDTGVTVATNTSYTIRIFVNKSLNEVQYELNGVIIGTITTNLPNSSTLMGMRTIAVKSVGTSLAILYSHGFGVTTIYPF